MWCIARDGLAAAEETGCRTLTPHGVSLGGCKDDRTTTLKVIALWIVVVLAAVSVLAAGAYCRDIGHAHERVQGRSNVVHAPLGDIEYVEAGDGIDVLVIHGAGGGFDQGELIAQALLGEGFRVVIPSRFGYLRSALPPGATWDDQADAYAYLLDHLGISRVAVVAMSQGGPSALLFAARHTERVNSLTCLSCGVVSSVTAEQSQADRRGDALRALFHFDAPYWIASRLFKAQLMALIGANDTVIEGLTQAQRESIGQFIEYMNPASLRTEGVVFDNEAPLPGDRIAVITAPTLLVHAADDELQLYHNAVFAAAIIPGSRLLDFETGGHVVVLVQQTIIRETLERHILDYTR